MAGTAEVCRTCLSPQALGPLFPVPEEHNKVQFAFYLTTGLKVASNDGLPQTICKYCNENIEALLLFRIQSRLAHRKLQEISADKESNIPENIQNTIILKVEATRKLIEYYNNPFNIPVVANYMHPNKSENVITEKVENLPILNDLLDLYKFTCIKYESNNREDNLTGSNEALSDIKNETHISNYYEHEPNCDKLIDCQGITIVKHELNNMQNNSIPLNPKKYVMDISNNVGGPLDDDKLKVPIYEIEINNAEDNLTVPIERTEGILNTASVNIDSVTDKLPELNDVLSPNLFEPKGTTPVNKIPNWSDWVTDRLAQIQKKNVEFKKYIPTDVRRIHVPILSASNTFIKTNELKSLTVTTAPSSTPCELRLSPNKGSEITINKYMVHNSKRKVFSEFELRCIDLIDGPFDRKNPYDVQCNKNLKCKVCGDSRLHFRTFKEHVQLHLGYNHICEFCGKGCTTKHKLKLHVLVHHTREFDFHCPHCNFKAPTNHTLQKHIKTAHATERTCICKECGKAYFSNTVLKQHIRWIHTGKDKPYKCDECPSRFPYAPDLKYHKKLKHSPQYKHYCHICNKTLSSAQQVRQHFLRVHKIPREQQVKKVHRRKFDSDYKRVEMPSSGTKIDVSSAIWCRLHRGVQQGYALQGYAWDEKGIIKEAKNTV